MIGMLESSLRIGPKESRRFLRFLTVGAGGTIIDFSMLSFLKLLGLSTLPANTLSFLAGVFNNFVWNRLWTFSEARGQRWNNQFISFVTVSLIGLLLNNTLMLLLEAPFESWIGYWGYIPSKAFATGIVVFWNYFANRFWTFRAKRKPYEYNYLSISNQNRT